MSICAKGKMIISLEIKQNVNESLKINDKKHIPAFSPSSHKTLTILLLRYNIFRFLYINNGWLAD